MADLKGLPAHLCDVVMRDGQALLERPGPGGVLVNGVRVGEEHALTAGDVIEVPETGIEVLAIRVQGASAP